MILDRLGKELLFFDGGMGTLLQEKGLRPGELPEVWNLEHTEEIVDIHRQYFEAGSDIVLTNTFGANALKFHSSEYDLEDIITAAVVSAREGAYLGVHDDRKVYVAMDIGPTGKLLKPLGDLDFETALSAFGEAAFAGLQDFAKKCAQRGIDTWFSVVDVIGEEKIGQCRRIARECGVALRVRDNR